MSVEGVNKQMLDLLMVATEELSNNSRKPNIKDILYRIKVPSTALFYSCAAQNIIYDETSYTHVIIP